MEKILNSDSFIMVTKNDEEVISIKDIKDSIKALNILGKNDIKIFAEIHVDFEYSKIKEEKIPKYYNCYMCKEITLIKGNKILYDNKFEIDVNVNKSFTDYEGEYVTWYINGISKILMEF